MKLKVISRFLALIVAMITAFMALPLVLAAIKEPRQTYVFAVSMLVGLTFSLLLRAYGRGAVPEDMGTREAFAVVTFSWVLASFVGAIPFIVSGAIPDFTDAYFEAMSGFTTTGATTLNEAETLPVSILLWRSQTQWLGGMGIVLLTIAVMPMLGVSVNQLFKAEAPCFQVEKVRPRMQDTAIMLWGVYMAVTAFSIMLLLAAGMNLFDAVCHAFAVVSTGGFSTHGVSFGDFNSALVGWATIALIFFCGTNFSLLLISLKKRTFTPYKDPEFGFYVKLIVCSSLAIAAFLQYNGVFSSPLDSLRYAFFQVTSIMTTTGFVTAGFEHWPVVTQMMLFLLMFAGGCSGSTSGGIKCSRALIVFKQIYAEMKRSLHPSAVISVRTGNRAIANPEVTAASAFVILYFTVFMASALLVSTTGQGLATSLSSVASTLTNTGYGMWETAPISEQHLSAKWVYIFCMLCGRLELYTILVLFTKDAWRR